jgi:hypothetical protein
MVDEKTKDDRRNFLGPDGETEYFIAAPSAEDVRGADWEYSKVYTRSLTEGITTNAEMMDILLRRGIIGPDFEQRANELAIILNNKIEVLEKSESIEEKRQLAIEVAEAREKLFQWNQRLNGPMNNTCEQIADDARLEYITACIVQKEDGSKVWDSYNTFLKEKSQALALKARYEVMLFLQGLDSDFLDRTPEALAMKEVEKDVMDKAEEAIKAIQAVADEEKKVDDIVEKEPEKKPRTRRRTSTKKK